MYHVGVNLHRPLYPYHVFGVILHSHEYQRPVLQLYLVGVVVPAANRDMTLVQLCELMCWEHTGTASTSG